MENYNTTVLLQRLKILKFALIAFAVVIILRLIQIQIIESEKYRDIAQKQYRTKVILPALRGSIYDRHGNVIVSNVILVSFGAHPRMAQKHMDSIARKFSKVFGKPEDYYLNKLKGNSKFVWLERKVSLEYVKRIDIKKDEGVVVVYEPKRLYHYNQVASQLIGITDSYCKGLTGIELYFDSVLRGTNGYVILQRDGLGNERPTIDYPRVEPINGHDIFLTIDIGLQAFAVEELKKGVELNKADGGMVVILNPKSGEILALAQYPTINPDFYNSYEEKDRKLRAITDMFEPGSVFKIVTASAALDCNLVPLDRKFYAENGVYVVKLPNGKTRVIKDVHPYQWLTFREAIEFSSNIVMAKISDIVGEERIYKMARSYGFGIQTNVELPGEVRGELIHPIYWSATTLNTIAYGYEINATPLQIAQAYAVIANNGVLMKPYILYKEVDENKQLVRLSTPQKIRNVISEKTAKDLKLCLEGVVNKGTAKAARVSSVKIAGKTGTSKKYEDSCYRKDKYIASFVGFFPSDDPKIVCLVMLDNPNGVNYTGGTTSAPIFKVIAERIINTQDIFETEYSQLNYAIGSDHKNSVDIKDVFTEKVPDIEKLNEEQIALANKSEVVVPNVVGFSVRKAVKFLLLKKFKPIVNGSGIVVSQYPLAGQPAKVAMEIILTCQPKINNAVSENR